MLNIQEPYPHKTAFLQSGFRPFFSAAIFFSIISISIWLVLYWMGWTLPTNTYPTIQWHAHEMVFGYGMAVAAGFLLTAIRNWTHIPTLQNIPLLILFLLWLSARILPFVLPSSWFWLIALSDLSFNFFLVVATSIPIYRAKQWKNSVFPAKMALLLIANALFYMGLLGVYPEGMHIGLYAGFYIILALILTMGRRIIPFFIEKGVGYPFQPKNWKWVDISNLILFLFFSIADIFYPSSFATLLLASSLLLLNSFRLYGWYTSGIWKKPLLWSLYLGYVWIVFGFLLKILSHMIGLSPFLAIHSFAYGGIGLITMGMMARISLGHTGRSVATPPKSLIWVFSLLTAGAIIRVIVPLFNMSFYREWILSAQVLWIAAFTIMMIAYIAILIKPRIDGKPD